MAEPEYHRALVGAAGDETPSLRRLALTLPPEVAASHTAAGQYVKVRAGGATAYLALATAPGLPAELLVKRGPGVGDALAALGPGDELELGRARGPGFPLGTSRGRDLLLFATGSGIAPIRAALQAVGEDRSAYGAVDLFYGVRTRDEFAYGAELEALVARGMRIHRIVSRPMDHGDEHVGYVQQRFQRELPPLENAVAMLCGQTDMTSAVTELLVQAGLPAARVHLNL